MMEMGMDMKNKIMMIFGTRPEAIKMAPLIKAIEKKDNYSSRVVVTGQHREMLDQILDTFKITPDYDLNIMHTGQTISEITSRILEQLPDILEKEKPDMVLVHGDTTTSFSAALAAFYSQIPIGHVEAGLRTGDKYSPYPEEMNRKMIDNLSDIYFAPTDLNKENLVNENISEASIYVTGNTITDALKYTISSKHKSKLLDSNKKTILLTIHRRENLGDSMKQVFKALNHLVLEFPNIEIIFPIHKNNKIRYLADTTLIKSDQIKIIEPLDVIDFHNILNKCYLVLTDSGGIQEEAVSLKVPTLVLRNTTERPEGITSGVLKLIGTSEERIYEEAKDILNNKNTFNLESNARNPYGQGESCLKILNGLDEFFKYT